MKKSAVLLVVFVLAFAGNALALRYVITPRLGFGGTFDDRVWDDKSDWYVRVAPGLSWELEQDYYTIKLSGDFSGYKYARYDEYDRVDQKYQLDVDYQYDERTVLGLQAAVRLDTDYEDELEEGRVVDIAATDRATYSLTPSFSFMVTARDRFDISYSFTMRENEADYNADHQGHAVNMAWTRLYSETLDLFLRLGGQRTAYDSAQGSSNSRIYRGELVQDTVSVMSGFSYRPSERLQLDIAAGAGQTFTDKDESMYDTGFGLVPVSLLGMENDDEKGSSTTYLINSSLQWKGERIIWSFGYDRDIYASADGYDVIRDSVKGNMSYRFTELCSLGASTLAMHLQDTSDRDQRDDWYYAITPFVSYRLSEETSLRFGYTFSHSKEKDQDAENRNRISCDYVINFPFEH